MKKFFLSIFLLFGMFLGIFFKNFHSHIFTKQISICNQTGYELESLQVQNTIRNFENGLCTQVEAPRFSKNFKISFTIFIGDGANKKIYQGQEIYKNKNSITLTHITFDNQNSLGNFILNTNQK